VIRPDSYNKLKFGSSISTAKFHENVSDFAIAYGLGVQVLGDARVKSNLLPKRVARAAAWSNRGKLFNVLPLIRILKWARIRMFFIPERLTRIKGRSEGSAPLKIL